MRSEARIFVYGVKPERLWIVSEGCFCYTLFMRHTYIISSLFVFASFLLLLPGTASAAVCSITTDTVIDQSYVDDPGNNCTSIDVQGNVSTTWLGTVNLGGGVVTVKSGYTMTMGSSSNMILGSADDFVVEANATATHRVNDTNGLRIKARNITITGELTAEKRGCQASGIFR